MAIIASNMRSIKKTSMLNKYERGIKGFCHVDEGNQIRCITGFHVNVVIFIQD